MWFIINIDSQLFVKFHHKIDKIYSLSFLNDINV